MLKMNADRWTFPLALCFICVSSNDKQYNEEFCEDPEFCETQELTALLGSSVLLPCTFTNSSQKWVLWADTVGVGFVNLSSEGRIHFKDPKSGRVKAFPNQNSKGNYSICIDELQDSDLGCYHCKTEGACFQVVVDKIDTLSKKRWLLIYICAGVAAFTLLSVCSYLIFSNRKQDNTDNPTGACIEVVGASAPPQEIDRPPVQELQRGVDNSVYENDDYNPANHQGGPTRNHPSQPGIQNYLDTTQPTQSTSGLYPNLNQFNFERVESQRTKLRFHRDLMTRLRQASISRHYYVNQRELNKQQAVPSQAKNPHRDVRKKKEKENCEYKNPIYNRSTDQINRL